jgi:predicted glutamine amidotransferase
MCLAISKKIGIKLDKEVYVNGWNNNSDGAGFAHIQDGELCIAKGFFSFNDFWEYFEPREEQTGLIHFRVGTSGGMNGENCHPWRVADTKKGDPLDLVFIHNGVISINRPYQNLSDTGNFNELILRDLVQSDPDFWKQAEFKWMIESAIGTNNKLVMMDQTGHMEIFNEKSGKWDNDAWFSNHTYSFSKTRSYNGHNCTNWQNQFDNDEYQGVSTSNSQPANRVFNYASSEATEGDFAGIDVEAIDARLEAAERKRMEKLNS